jgi:hypothetical protein
MGIGERRGQVEEAKAGAEREDQQERDAIAIDRRPRGCERTDGLIKSDSLDVVRPRRRVARLESQPRAHA